MHSSFSKKKKGVVFLQEYTVKLSPLEFRPLYFQTAQPLFQHAMFSIICEGVTAKNWQILDEQGKFGFLKCQG